MRVAGTLDLIGHEDIEVQHEKRDRVSERCLDTGIGQSEAPRGADTPPTPMRDGATIGYQDVILITVTE